jgi:hypothetical protein
VARFVRVHEGCVRPAMYQGGGELVDAIAQEVVADTGQRKNPLHDFKPKGALAGQEILEELAEVNRHPRGTRE